MGDGLTVILARLGGRRPTGLGAHRCRARRRRRLTRRRGVVVTRRIRGYGGAWRRLLGPISAGREEPDVPVALLVLHVGPILGGHVAELHHMTILDHGVVHLCSGRDRAAFHLGILDEGHDDVQVVSGLRHVADGTGVRVGITLHGTSRVIQEHWRHHGLHEQRPGLLVISLPLDPIQKHTVEVAGHAHTEVQVVLLSHLLCHQGQRHRVAHVGRLGGTRTRNC